MALGAFEVAVSWSIGKSKKKIPSVQSLVAHRYANDLESHAECYVMFWVVHQIASCIRYVKLDLSISYLLNSPVEKHSWHNACQEFCHVQKLINRHALTEIFHAAKREKRRLQNTFKVCSFSFIVDTKKKIDIKCQRRIISNSSFIWLSFCKRFKWLSWLVRLAESRCNSKSMTLNRLAWNESRAQVHWFVFFIVRLM